MKRIKKILASLMVVVMVLTAAPLSGFVGFGSGLKAEAAEYKSGDVVTFGMYPQTRVSNSALLENLAQQECDSKGMVYYEGQDYMQIGSDYYLYEPITWRVLSVDSDGIYLMAEKILDSQSYNESYSYVTWAESTLRNWLNNEFYDLAFSFSEKKKVNKTHIINDNNPYFGTAGGDDTYDSVFIPSLTDVLDSSKGFSTDNNEDESREAAVTDFSKSRGVATYGGTNNSYWWIRTPGSNGRWACYVNYYGKVYNDGRKVNNYGYGIRPAIKLSLSSSIYEAKELSNYQLRITDDITGNPISGAKVTFRGVTQITSADGTAMISTDEVVSNTAMVNIQKDGYFNLNIKLYELSPYIINTISLEDENNPISKMFADVYLEGETIKGPDVSVLGETFPLFSCESGLNIPLSKITKLNVSTEQDTRNKTVKYVLGVNPGYSLDTDKKRSEDYQEFKSFYKMMTGASNQKTWDTYNKLRRKLKDGKGSLGFECGVTFAGYVEFSYATGEMVFSEGGIVVLGEAEVSTDVPFLGFCYATFKLGGEVEGKLSLTQTSSGTLDVSTSIGISYIPTIGVGARAVSNDLASIEAGISGKITGTVTVPASSFKEAFEATLSANCYIKVKAGFVYEKKWSTNFPALELYPNTGEFQTNSFGNNILLDENGNIVTISKNDLELIDRSYINDITFNTSSLDSGSLNDSSVYPYGCPKLIKLDNGKIVALFVYDDGTKSDINRTTLYYSVCENGTWSVALPVYDSGFADFSAEVCTDGSKVYAVWQRASEIYDDSYEVEDIVAKTELVYSEFDGLAWSAPAVIDTADKYQRMYHISQYSGNIAVAWAENVDNGYSLENEAATVLYKTLSRGVWSAEKTVCTQKLVNDLAIGYVKGSWKVIYSVDTDNEIPGDSEVYVSGAQVTSNNVDEGEISYQNGVFCWIQEGELYTYDPVNKVGVATGLKLENDYRIIKTDSVTAVTYLKKEDFVNELMISYFINGEYTNPVKLTEYGKHISYYDAVVNNDGTVVVLADVENLSSDVNDYPYTTTDMVCDVINGFVDLEITDVMYEGVVSSGSEISFVGSITNNGIASVDSYTVNFKDAFGNIILSEKVNETLEAGETTEFCVSYIVPSDFSKQTIDVEVISEEDSVLQNNKTDFIIGYADIEIIGAEISRDGVFKAEVINRGYENAQNVTVNVYFSNDVNTLLKTFNLGSIGIDETKEITFALEDQYLKFESAYVANRFKVESMTDTEEANIGNNAIEAIYEPVAVESISMNTEALTLEFGQSSQLIATIFPLDAYNPKVHWVSDSIDAVKVDENGRITAVGTGTAVITAIADDGGLVTQCEVEVKGIQAMSTAFVDFENNMLFGLDANLSSLDSYIDLIDESCILSYGLLATDSKVQLIRNTKVVAEYTIIIFGDVNGDSWYDGQDAVLVSCLANGMLTQEDVSEAVYMAADCNHDGVIDQLDVALLNQAGTLLANVDQSKPTEVLLETSSEYVEYLDLIDQSPEIDVEDDTDIPEGDVDTTPEQDAGVDIFEMIMNFIRSIIEMILSRIPVPYK